MHLIQKSHLQRTLLEATFILFFSMILAIACAMLNPHRPPFTKAIAKGRVTVDQLNSWKSEGKHVVIIDARASKEFESDRIPDAVPLNEDRWEEQLPGVIGKWSPGEWIVVYCNSEQCDASEAVAVRLRRELGLSDGEVYVLDGGWNSWLASQRQH